MFELSVSLSARKGSYVSENARRMVAIAMTTAVVAEGALSLSRPGSDAILV